MNLLQHLESSSAPLVDDWMPRFDVESSHSILIAAPHAVVYQIAAELDLSRSFLIRVLFRVRGLPTSALRRDGLARSRFKLLHEDPGKEFALGVIGQFWTLGGHLVDFDPTRFRDFGTPGYAKAVWSFSVHALTAGSSRLTTVTRVLCLDDQSRRKFRRYWRFIGPFSGIIRSECLRLVRDTSESNARGST